MSNPSDLFGITKSSVSLENPPLGEHSSTNRLGYGCVGPNSPEYTTKQTHGPKRRTSFSPTSTCPTRTDLLDGTVTLAPQVGVQPIPNTYQDSFPASVLDPIFILPEGEKQFYTLI